MMIDGGMEQDQRVRSGPAGIILRFLSSVKKPIHLPPSTTGLQELLDSKEVVKTTILVDGEEVTAYTLATPAS